MRSTGNMLDTIPGLFQIYMRARDNIKHHNVSCLPIVLYGNLKGVLLPKHVRNNTYKSGLVEHLNMGIYPAN
jgi:hypothetical protein